ncbi:MAG: right-handed parallel beta-helix repeat-containing protein, partial [Armatimonadota bacterium]|nr:right-handed parallel beta-helix repeat-containing protein [Armatimonadota bacterium]
PDEGGTVHVPAGRWEIDATAEIALREGQHLFIVGDGRASVLVNTSTSGDPLLSIAGAIGEWWPDLNITIRDLSMEGNYDSGHALVIDHPNDTMVDGCFFIGHGGTAVQLVSQGTNATVRDCWMRDCRRALSAENVHHLTMHGNQTRRLNEGQIQEEHVYIDPNCREVRIVGNHLAYGDAEGIVLDGTAQHVISGNTIEGFMKGIYAIGCRDMVISSNYLHAPVGIHLAGACNGFAITGNTMVNTTEAGVLLEDAGGSGAHTISSNVIRKSVYADIVEDTRQGGIRLGGASNCVVASNVLEDVTDDAAIVCLGGGGHVVSGNRIVRCAGEPIRLTCEGWCAIADNLTDRT